MTQGSDQAPSSKESPRPLTTYSKQRATEFRPELADHHHSSIEAASMSRRCPVSSAQCSPKERGTKRKALGIDKRSARFLCAVSIFLHRGSPFCEPVQVATNDWIVAARDARAHYMFLLGGDRRPLLGMWVTALRWSTSPNTATQLGLRRDNTRVDGPAAVISRPRRSAYPAQCPHLLPGQPPFWELPLLTFVLLLLTTTAGWLGVV
jgi:hypothetical protein